jgi:HK97 family phage prohead protease
MQTRDFRLNVKALEDSGAFTGIASPYGDPPDLVGDVIEPGAYRQAIAQQGKGYPLLWAHDTASPIGLGTIADSKDGLIVNGQLLMSDPVAQRAHDHLKAGTIKGLSIGYTVPRGEGKVSFRDDGARLLKEVRLHEISVVAVPAAPRAQVTTLKSLGDVRAMLKGLRNVDEETIDELLEIDFELKRILKANPQNADSLRQLEAFAAELKQGVFA